MSHHSTYTRLEKRFLQTVWSTEAPAGASLDESLAYLVRGCQAILRQRRPARRAARNALKLNARRRLAEHGPGIHRWGDCTGWRFVIRLDGRWVAVALFGGTVAHCLWADRLTRATKEALEHFPVTPVIRADTNLLGPLSLDPIEYEQPFEAWVDARVEELATTGAVPRPRPKVQVSWTDSGRGFAAIHVWLDLPEFTEAWAERVARELGAVFPADSRAGNQETTGGTDTDKEDWT